MPRNAGLTGNMDPIAVFAHHFQIAQGFCLPQLSNLCMISRLCISRQASFAEALN